MDSRMRRHFIVLVLLLFFAALPFFKLFALPGVIAKGDYTFPRSTDQIWRAIVELSHPWDPNRYAGFARVTDQASNAAFLLPLLFLCVFLPCNLANALWLVLLTFTASACMYFLVFRLNHDHQAALVSGIAYAYCTFFGNFILGGFRGHLMAYAVTPGVILLLMGTLRSCSRTKAVECGIAFGFLMTLALPQTAIVFLVLIVYAGFLVLTNGFGPSRSLFGRIWIALSSVGLILAVGLLLNSFWIMPYLARVVSTGSLHPATGYFSAAETVIRNTRFFGFLEGMQNNSAGEFQGAMYSYGPLSKAIVDLALSFLALVAFLALLVRPSRETVFFGLVALGGILLAAGAIGPFGAAYLWLYTHLPFFIMFNRPMFFQSMIALSFPVMIGIVLTHLRKIEIPLSRPRLPKLTRRTRVRFITIVLIMLVVLSSWPMISGNIMGRLRTFEFPQEYRDVDAWLRTHGTGYRALLMPPYDAGQWEWFPPNADNEKGIRYAPFNNPLVEYPPMPTITLGWGISYNGLAAFAINAMYLERGMNVAKILGVLGIRYVVFSLDQLDVSAWDPSYAPYQNTTKVFLDMVPRMEGLREVWRKGSIVVLENQFALPRFLSTGLSLVAGDRKVMLSLAALKGFNYSELALAFADQIGGANPAFLESVPLLIVQGDHWLDLTLDSVDGAITLEPWLYAKAVYNYAEDWSTSDRVYNFEVWRWTDPFYLELPYDDVDKWAITKGRAPLDMTFEVSNQDEYEIWAKIFVGCLSYGSQYEFTPSTLLFDMDGQRLRRVAQTEDQSGRFEWIRIGKTILRQGIHVLSMRNELAGSFSIVSRIVVAPTRMLTSAQASIDTAVGRQSLDVLHIMDSADFQTSGASWKTSLVHAPSASDGVAATGIYGHLSKEVQIMKSGSYVLAVRLEGNASQAKLSVDTVQSFSFEVSGGWNYYCAGPIYLQAGRHQISVSIPHGVQFDNLLLYTSSRRVDPSSYLVKYGGNVSITYQSSKPTEYVVTMPEELQRWLIFLESYDQFWVAESKAQRASPFPVFSFANSFEFSGDVSRVHVVFEPEYYQSIGTAITVVGLLLCIAVVAPDLRRTLASRRKPLR